MGAGELDEMELHVVPVLLGRGRRLFDHLGPERIELELVRVLQGRQAAHLRYRVVHGGCGSNASMGMSRSPSVEPHLPTR
jgi:hypothetical protein